MVDEAGNRYDMLTGASGTAPSLEEIWVTWTYWGFRLPPGDAGV